MIGNNVAADAMDDPSLFALDDIPSLMEFDLFKTLDRLIDAWCERRALRPLAFLLAAYPGVFTQPVQEFELLDALKNVKRLCQDHLTSEELRLITQVHDRVGERLQTRII
jgi:hypothetical protein